MSAPFHKRHSRALIITGSIIGALIIAIFVLSYFLDPLIRSRTESAMNRSLKGYHTQLAAAHLQLLTGTLTLKGLTIVQNAHPNPPIADIKELRVSLDLDSLLARRIVAKMTIEQPRLHINLLQLKTEATSEAPVKQQGWQQAVEAIYPFRINRLAVDDGALTYIGTDPRHPLELTQINLSASNIRNVHSQRASYPSPIHLTMVAFHQGRIVLDGNADFLATPSAAVKAQYWTSHLPLSQFTPELQHVNFQIEGGVLESRGIVEYSSSVERIEVYDATLERVNLGYVHQAATAHAEQQRAHEVKTAAQAANNKAGLLLKLDHFGIRDSTLSYTDQATQPAYKLFLTHTTMDLSNLSNQAQQGNSTLKLNGKFMDSGDTQLTGTFRAEPAGPDFNLTLAINNTNLVALNDLLDAYGRLRVARGDFSLYTQMTSVRGDVNGYIKPLFSNLKVYDYQKDKDKPLLKQAYKLAVGALASVVKNHSSEKVATQTNISGNISQPHVNTWQAAGQLIENAFIKTILPGFDREVKTTPGANQS